MNLSINGLVQLCHEDSSQAGWWDRKHPDIDPRKDPDTIASKIALIHAEVSEALEGMRKDLMDDHLPHRKMFEVELADAIIRICDLAGSQGMNLQDAIHEKMAYNRHRQDHKREHRQRPGGKKI